MAAEYFSQEISNTAHSHKGAKTHRTNIKNGDYPTAIAALFLTAKGLTAFEIVICISFQFNSIY
jgi:hypothetical protein